MTLMQSQLSRRCRFVSPAGEMGRTHTETSLAAPPGTMDVGLWSAGSGTGVRPERAVFFLEHHFTLQNV